MSDDKDYEAVEYCLKENQGKLASEKAENEKPLKDKEETEEELQRTKDQVERLLRENDELREKNRAVEEKVESLEKQLKQDWRGISREFEKVWNFPNCIGAIDGKHIAIQAPALSGSYYNYNGTHSVVLSAVCDAHYRFTLVDIGSAGRENDSGVLSNSTFGQALESGSLCLPSARALPGSTIKTPFVFVGDAAFPLCTDMLRPYPGQNLPDLEAVFNYRLSRCRRVIENSFGILAARWRIFRRPIITTPENAVIFTKAAIALHNFLCTTESAMYCPSGFTNAEDGAGNVVEGNWRNEVGSGSLNRAGRLGSNLFS